jgi:hypothetical protein
MRGGRLCQTSCNSLKYLILVTGIYASSWSQGPPAIQTFSSLGGRTDSHGTIFVLVRCLKPRVRTIKPASSFCLNGENVRVYLAHETSALHDCESRFSRNGCASTGLVCVSFFLGLVSLVLVMLRVHRRW